MRIPHNRPTVGREELCALERVITSRWMAQGMEVSSFENEMCEFLGLPEGHAVALSSGTAALYIAMWSLNAAGKRVAIPAYTCAAVRNAAVMAQATPVFVDNALGSCSVDFDQIEGVDVAVVAHMYGIPVELKGCLPGISVIEDCAQSLGARIDGTPVGGGGELGIFSFYATKMITTGGQGGMVVSKDQALIEGIRDYREFDRRSDDVARFNFQMTDTQAAMGRVQLGSLERYINKRKEVYSIYKDEGLPLWSPTQFENGDSCRFRALLKTEAPKHLIKALGREGIGAIIPIEDWEILGGASDYPRANDLSNTLVSLPIYPSLGIENAKKIAETVKKFTNS